MKRKTNLELIAALLAFLVFIVATQYTTNFDLTKSFDDVTLRIVTMVLALFTIVQSVGLYTLSKRPTVATSEVCDAERGRGRPRKPCSLALTGVLVCPLEPSLELDSAFIERIRAALENSTVHKRLVERKLDDIDPDRVELQSERKPTTEKKGVAAKEPEEKKMETKDEQLPVEVATDSEFGEVAAEILSRRTNIKLVKKVKEEKT